MHHITNLSNLIVKRPTNQHQNKENVNQTLFIVNRIKVETPMNLNYFALYLPVTDIG